MRTISCGTRWQLVQVPQQSLGFFATGHVANSRHPSCVMREQSPRFWDAFTLHKTNMPQRGP